MPMKDWRSEDWRTKSKDREAAITKAENGHSDSASTRNKTKANWQKCVSPAG